MKFWTTDYVGEISKSAEVGLIPPARGLSTRYVKLMQSIYQFKYISKDDQIMR